MAHRSCKSASPGARGTTREAIWLQLIAGVRIIEKGIGDRMIVRVRGDCE